MRKELQDSDDFYESVREEVRISSEFDLPLGALCVRLSDGPDEDLTRRLLDGIRTADLAAAVSAGEIAVVLPNTSSENTRLVAERLLAVIPEASIDRSIREPGDTPETLLARARGGSARRSG